MRNVSKLAGLLCMGLWLMCTENPSQPDDAQTGIVDFVSVNGVKLQETTAPQIIDILGYPREVNEEGAYSYYYYPDEGIKYTVDSLKRVVRIDVFSSDWVYSLGSDTIKYQPYAYTTQENIAVGDTLSTMDSVVARYGEPGKKAHKNESNPTSPGPWYFQYHETVNGKARGMRFYFWGKSVTEFKKKPITAIMLWTGEDF